MIRCFRLSSLFVLLLSFMCSKATLASFSDRDIEANGATMATPGLDPLQQWQFSEEELDSPLLISRITQRGAIGELADYKRKLKLKRRVIIAATSLLLIAAFVMRKQGVFVHKAPHNLLNAEEAECYDRGWAMFFATFTGFCGGQFFAIANTGPALMIGVLRTSLWCADDCGFASLYFWMLDICLLAFAIDSFNSTYQLNVCT